MWARGLVRQSSVARAAGPADSPGGDHIVIERRRRFDSTFRTRALGRIACLPVAARHGQVYLERFRLFRQPDRRRNIFRNSGLDDSPSAPPFVRPGPFVEAEARRGVVRRRSLGAANGHGRFIDEWSGLVLERSRRFFVGEDVEACRRARLVLARRQPVGRARHVVGQRACLTLPLQRRSIPLMAASSLSRATTNAAGAA